jgi:hypothetical protein
MLLQDYWTDRNQKRLILCGFILLLFIHVLISFAGFYNNDDINYARHAAAIMHNGIDFSPAADQFQLRWTTIYSTAFFYRLFGINDFTSALSSLISFSLCGLLLQKILLQKKLSIYFFSMLIFFFAHSTIFYSHRLLADPAMAFAVLWMYFSYRNYHLKNIKPGYYGLQFAVAFFLAVITKETIIIILPLFAFFFINDIFKKRLFRFWMYAGGSSLILVFCYLLYFKITTGDFFYRYHVLENINRGSATDFAIIKSADVISRIGYLLWKAMLLNGDMLIYMTAVSAFLYRKKLQLTTAERLDSIGFVILLLSANLMTISFKYYVPLPHDPRHFLFLIPFAALTGGRLLTGFISDPKRYLLLPLFMIIATTVMFLLNTGLTKYLYFLFTAALLFAYLLQYFLRRSLSIKSIVLILTPLFFINYLIDILKPVYPFYADHKKVIERNFIGKNDHAVVVSADAFSGEMSEYFLKFNTGKIKFIAADSVKDLSTDEGFYLLVGDLNPGMKEKIDLIRKTDSSSIKIIDSMKNVYLYQFRKRNLPLLIMK